MSRLQRLLHRAHWPHRWVLRVAVALVAAAVIVVAAMVAIDRTFFSDQAQVCAPQATRASHPMTQRILDGVVGGPVQARARRDDVRFGPARELAGSRRGR